MATIAGRLTVEHSRGTTATVVALAFTIVAALHVDLLFRKEINWDEFHHLDHIFALWGGYETQPLQTIHARLFAWLRFVKGSSIDQLQVARMFMLLFEAATCTFIALICCRFMGRAAAWTCALLFLTSGFVLTQGFTFRADPQAAALLMSVVWLLACRPLHPGNAAVGGAMIGLAGMVTIKSAFYAPSIAAVALWRWHEGEGIGSVLGHLATMLLAALGTFGILFGLHAAAMPSDPLGESADALGSAGSTVFSAGFVPRLDSLVLQLEGSLPTAVALVAGFVLWPRRQWLVPILLLLPLLSVLIYRNAYPYFFVFILPPAMIVAGHAIELVGRRIGYTILVLIALLNAFLLWSRTEPPLILFNQRTLVAGVREIFPDRVGYFDFCGMLGSYRRELPFLISGWGLQRYRDRGIPQFRQRMESDTIPLLLLNDLVLQDAMGVAVAGEHVLPEDKAALQANYIQHWGPVWVAGKVIQRGADPAQIEVLVPGTYTLEGTPLTINGHHYVPGQTVQLSRGRHRVEGGRKFPAILRWGTQLAVPIALPPKTLFGYY